MLLFEHDITFNPLVDRLRVSIPGSTMVYWHKRDAKGLEQILKTRPILARSYLVVFSQPPKQDVVKLMKEYTEHCE